MNRKQLIAAAALTLLGSAAFAQSEIELQHFGANQPSVVSRSEVRAELQRARAAGEVPAYSEVVAQSPKAGANDVQRAQVRGDVLKARANGSLAQPVEARIQAGY